MLKLYRKEVSKLENDKGENISGNYNHDNGGVVTEGFLEKVIKAAGKDARYVTVHGYFNLGKPNTMTFQGILNFMYSKNYKFVTIISQEGKLQAEILFQHI